MCGSPDSNGNSSQRPSQLQNPRVTTWRLSYNFITIQSPFAQSCFFYSFTYQYLVSKNTNQQTLWIHTSVLQSFFQGIWFKTLSTKNNPKKETLKWNSGAESQIGQLAMRNLSLGWDGLLIVPRILYCYNSHQRQAGIGKYVGVANISCIWEVI